MIKFCGGRERVIEENLGLVHACANRFRSRGVDYDDLYQAGCVGLVKAADGYDESKGFAFSTYAVPVILGEIKRIFRDGGAVKVGRAMKQKAQIALKEKEKLALRIGREPTVGELAEILSLDPAETAELLNSAQPPLSLTIYDEEGASQFDLPVEAPEESVSDRLALREVMNHLPDRDRTLIDLRYYKGFTQARAARELGMTQVQVSRREKAILAGLKKSLLR